MNISKLFFSIAASLSLLAFSNLASAGQMVCKGSEVNLTVLFDMSHKAVGVTNVWAADPKISAALNNSSDFDGPDTSNDVTLPDYIQASFPTPDGYYSTGTWTLSLNPKTGMAVLGYDDFDGDMRSFNLTCR
jgi:hypothetical protein